MLFHFSDVGARQTQAADGARPAEGATKTSAAQRGAAAASTQTTSRRRRSADDGGGVKEKKHERGRSGGATRQQQEGGENGEHQQQGAQTTARGLYSLLAALQKIVGDGKNRSRAQHQRKHGNHEPTTHRHQPGRSAKNKSVPAKRPSLAWLIRDQSGQLHRNEDVPVRGKVAATRATPLSRCPPEASSSLDMPAFAPNLTRLGQGARPEQKLPQWFIYK